MGSTPCTDGDCAHPGVLSLALSVRGHSGINYGTPLIYAVIMNLILRSLLNCARRASGTTLRLSAHTSGVHFATYNGQFKRVNVRPFSRYSI